MAFPNLDMNDEKKNKKTKTQHISQLNIFNIKNNYGN